MPRSKGKASTAGSGLPAGFKSAAVEGSFGQLHDFDKTPVLQGVCIKIQTVNKGTKKENDVMTIKAKDGTLHSVWKSYQLDGLFQKSTVGKEIYLQFDGVQKLKGRKSMKLFTVGVK